MRNSGRHEAPVQLFTAMAMAIALLGGCGIDQGGAPAPTAGPVADSPGALLVVGPITGFGSVHVNGITLQTAAADIRMDGEPVSESALREGQIIRAVAAVTSTSIDAVSIEYQANLRGPVGVLEFGGRIVILGQTVDTDARTLIRGGNSVNDLLNSGPLEVSGILLPNGVLRATYIGIADPAEPLTATAAITSTDVNALTFELDALTVDYSQTLILDVPTGIPDVGVVVEVRGTDIGAGGELIVSEVRALPRAPGDVIRADTAEASFAAVGSDAATDLHTNIFSVITAANLPSSITLGEVTVSIDALTRIDNGVADDLVPGRLVQIEGDATEAGLIQADRIELL